MPKAYDPKPTPTKRKTPYPSTHSKKPSSNPQDREEKQQTSINNLKRRIRDVKRLLNKPDLPADKRIIQERALKGYEKELGDEEKRRERSKMIKKYHFVRFLDRKTATKEINKLTRKRDDLIESTPLSTEMDTLEESKKKKKLAKLQARLHVAKVNLNYTIYYPLTEKYISIYAEKKKKGQDGENEEEEGDEDEEPEEKEEAGKGKKELSVIAERKAMWSVVERCMEDGTLDLLREGKLDLGGGGGEEKRAEKEAESRSKKDTGDKKSGSKEKGKKSNNKSSKPDTRKGKSSKHAPPAPADDDGDDSDGGFFEV
ncbi:hypothetical protein BDV12DRAFT_160828 [Aspergillus spectabilis]